ncbi:hypothetical protein IL38_24205 [Actinopolyspora erythraea]|uniref:Uncharacterized protein n=1 Tax=Actinopolyspora erythraea TaxID=414996 RepID=A0ABR4WYE6_9ACTN|nr:hypothetical protein [Actinopolyspora erythraea]KGI79400.1 hypothetical protein IL38_24205 [Actinopolyspora erythraea]
MLQIRHSPPRGRRSGTHLGNWRRSRSALGGTALVTCDAPTGPQSHCSARYATATQDASTARSAAADHGWRYDPQQRRDYCPRHAAGGDH